MVTTKKKAMEPCKETEKNVLWKVYFSGEEHEQDFVKSKMYLKSKCCPPHPPPQISLRISNLKFNFEHIQPSPPVKVQPLQIPGDFVQQITKGRQHSICKCGQEPGSSGSHHPQIHPTCTSPYEGRGHLPDHLRRGRTSWRHRSKKWNQRVASNPPQSASQDDQILHL